jgi:hypothetical protein
MSLSTLPKGFPHRMMLDLFARIAGYLNSSHNKQNDHNQEDEADTARGVITPATAIRPSGQRADQDNYKDDQENCSYAHRLAPRGCSTCRSRNIGRVAQFLRAPNQAHEGQGDQPQPSQVAHALSTFR